MKHIILSSKFRFWFSQIILFFQLAIALFIAFKLLSNEIPILLKIIVGVILVLVILYIFSAISYNSQVILEEDKLKYKRIFGNWNYIKSNQILEIEESTNRMAMKLIATTLTILDNQGDETYIQIPSVNPQGDFVSKNIENKWFNLKSIKKGIEEYFMSNLNTEIYEILDLNSICLSDPKNDWEGDYLLLAEAIKADDVERIKQIDKDSKKVINFNKCSSVLNVPLLLLAVLHKNINSIKMLVKLGSDVNKAIIFKPKATNQSNYIASLISLIAHKANFFEVLEVLLELGASPNSRDINMPIMHHILSSSEIDEAEKDKRIKLLIDKKANPNIINNAIENITPIQIAKLRNYKYCVELLEKTMQ